MKMQTCMRIAQPLEQGGRMQCMTHSTAFLLYTADIPPRNKRATTNKDVQPMESPTIGNFLLNPFRVLPGRNQIKYCP